MAITSSPAEMNLAMMEFFYSTRDKLDDNLRDALQAAVTNPNSPESTATFSEIVYANREEFTPEELGEAIPVVEFATQYRFYGLGEAARGALMLALLRGDEVAEEDQPRPDPRFVFAAPPEVERPVMPPPPEEGQA